MKINRKSLHFSSGVGALICLEREQPTMSRKQTRCSNLIKSMKNMWLGNITEQDVDAGQVIFSTLQESLDQISEESGIPVETILVALVCFHLDELEPLPGKVKRKAQSMIECWPESDEYKAIRCAHRLWQRMETEIELQEIDQ